MAQTKLNVRGNRVHYSHGMVCGGGRVGLGEVTTWYHRVGVPSQVGRGDVFQLTYTLMLNSHNPNCSAIYNTEIRGIDGWPCNSVIPE